MKSIILYGKSFDVVRAGTKEAESIERSIERSIDWGELYKRPSKAKQHIMESWDDWFYVHNGGVYGYRGNGFQFIIYGYLMLNQERYTVYISRAYNKIVM